METGFVRHYRELQVYQLAFENAQRVYQVAGQLPKAEQSLQNKLVSVSRSVCSNIAMAWDSKGWSLSGLVEAKRCVNELQVWLTFATESGLIDVSIGQTLEANYRCISEIIEGLVEIFSGR